jgi:hypothetical protein
MTRGMSAFHPEADIDDNAMRPGKKRLPNSA